MGEVEQMRSANSSYPSDFPIAADSEVLKKYPAKRPSDPSMLQVFEQGQLKLFRMLFMNLPDGVVVTDVHGFITEANPSALEIFGLRAGELEGQSVFYNLEDEYGAPINEIIGRSIIRGVPTRDRQITVLRPNGDRRACTLSVFPLVEDGKILRAVGVFSDRTELMELVQIDEKTKLMNHRTFLQRVQEQVITARRKDRPLALVYLDLRRFKELNDRFGHEEGDRVIKMVARRLEEALFKTDLKARSNCAGDEFMALLSEIDADYIRKAAEKIANRMTFETELIDNFGRLIPVQISADIGICWRRGEHIPDAKAFINLADVAMYECKKRVKNGELRNYWIDRGII